MGKVDLSDKEKIFRTQVGQGSTVSRETIGEEKAAIPNRQLCDLGLSLNPISDHLSYKGSAAVHIYWNATLQQVFFVSQVNGLDLYKCPESLALRSFDDLLGTLKQMYGHKRPRLRSGF